MEDQYTPTPQGDTIVEPMPFTEKITNLFASPGELFDNVRDTPNTTSNWLVPLAVFIVVAIAMWQIMLHNPSLLGQLRDQIDKSFQESISQGKMTPDQADQARSMSNPASGLGMILGAVGMVIMPPIGLFVLALVYWLMGKSIMKADVPYIKVAEVVGLTFFLSALESIVTTILMIGLDNLHATPSLGLAVMNDFAATNKLHILLSKVNVFTIWNIAVTGIGLAHLFRKDVPKVLVLVFALWILWVAFIVLSGMKFGG
jgi:hypothetical protein